MHLGALTKGLHSLKFNLQSASFGDLGLVELVDGLRGTVGLKKSVCTGHPTNFPPPNTHSSNIYFSAIILAIKVKVVSKESQEDDIQYLVY